MLYGDGDPGGEGVSSILWRLYMEGRLGESFESHRKESPPSPECLFHSSVRVIGPPDLPLQPRVSTPFATSNNIPCLFPTAILAYLGVLRRGRRSREGTGEKELFQQRGGED